ncbi:Uncharacterized protein APZ42_018765 [Daphnia magna]|uniref:Uncharacterized protein n=1 Tax=Daphnia magna TaxID=35525 RepID=A0A164YTB2_9CRUS|nr:Uncharacterized protein APZ42_018765 [Daphnia magna]
MWVCVFRFHHRVKCTDCSDTFQTSSSSNHELFSLVFVFFFFYLVRLEIVKTNTALVLRLFHQVPAV